MAIEKRIAQASHVEIEAAYKQVAQRVGQVSGAENLRVNVDAVHAFTVVSGSLPEILEHRAAIEQKVPSVANDVDMLLTYGYALLHVHAEWRTVLHAPDVVPELAAKALAMRETLTDDARVLARRNLLDGTDLKALRGTTGHKNVAADLLDLTGILRRNWDKIVNKCGTDLEELDRATALAMQILFAVGYKEQAPARANTLTLERRRAFKLLLDAYESVRLALRFVLPTQADVDRVAPSVYVGRPKRAPGADDVDLLEPGDEVDEATANANANAAAPITPGLRGGDPLGGE